MLSKIQSKKFLLFGLCGMIGGVIGTLPAFLVWLAGFAFEGDFMSLLFTSFWMGTAGSFLTLSLFLSGEIYNRRSLRNRKVWITGLLAGLLGGLAAGFAGQALFMIRVESMFSPHVAYYFRQYFFRSICWGLAGGIIGAAVAKVIPNLGWRRGALGGFIGGCLGGLGFIASLQGVISLVAPSGTPDERLRVLKGLHLIGHMIGFAILGLAIALAIVMVEAFFREACVEVVWGRNESTKVSLGPRLVTIGGGDDSIRIPGLPPRAAGVRFENGQITYLDLRSNQTHPLRDGSRLKVGRVELVVHARS